MIEPRYRKTVAEFFAGIGLMREGLEKANWRVILANDIDPVKRKLYLNHFSNADGHFLLDDIHRLDPANIPEVSLATASFPCTDLSLAGRRAGLQGAHSSAFWGFVDILGGMGVRKPPLILLENVAGFLTSNGGKDFKNALLALNKVGYSVDAFIINAVNFVPQSRVRLFIVGKLVNNREESIFRIKHYLNESGLRPAKIIEFISGHPEINWDINPNLPNLPELSTGLADIVEKLPKRSRLWWSEDRVEYLLNQTFERHLSQILVLKGDNKYHYLTAFRCVRDGKSMAEIRFDNIAGCLRTPKGGSARQILLQVGKGEINVRLLTPRECARLMGANDFNLSGTKDEALFGFGDAVCVPVVSWIAEHYLNPALARIINEQKQNLVITGNYAATA